MFKYFSLFFISFFCVASLCVYLPVQAAQTIPVQQVPSSQQAGQQPKQQGMDVYGGAYTPPQAPTNTLPVTGQPAVPVAPPSGAGTNNQGFQTFQVSQPNSGAPAGAPSLVQPPIQNLGKNPGQNPATTSGQVVIPTGPGTGQGQKPIQPPLQNQVQNQGQRPAQNIVPQNAPLMPPAAPANQQKAIPAPKATQEAMNKTYLEASKDFSEAKYAQAIALWQKLASEGHAPSMVALGLLQDRGHSDAKIPVNTKEALTWFRKGAELGHRDGMYHLGRMLVHGRGNATGKKHADTAAVWFRKAADLGQHDAQYALGVLYERGEGVVRSLKDAVAWYSHAAAGQNVAAQARLGHFYRVGQGVPQNLSRATLLLYGATMAGNIMAQEELFAMAKEKFPKEFPKVTLFGANLGEEQGVTRATMRSALSVSKVPALREDINFICDVYDLGKVVPGSKEMAICYGSNDAKVNKGDQEIGFIKIDYPAKTVKDAKVIQDMVTQRFGPPIAGEYDQGHLWNLGSVIVATQYEPKNQEVGLMYMIPRVYHTTQGQ